MSGKIKKSQLSKEDKEIQTLEEKRKKEMAKYIGENIRKYRTDLKLTREQLAEKSHITASHLYQLEIGNSVPSVQYTVEAKNENLLFSCSVALIKYSNAVLSGIVSSSINQA